VPVIAIVACRQRCRRTAEAEATGGRIIAITVRWPAIVGFAGQGARRGELARDTCNVQRGAPGGIGRSDVSPGLHKHGNVRHGTEGHGMVQRRRALGVPCVRVNAAEQQPLQILGIVGRERRDENIARRERSDALWVEMVFLYINRTKKKKRKNIRVSPKS
jgi:hypothetical protein